MGKALVHVSMTDKFSVVDITGYIELFMFISGDSACHLKDFVSSCDKIHWCGWDKKGGSLFINADREFTTYFLSGIYPDAGAIYMWSDDEHDYLEWHPPDEILDRMGISKK